MKKKIVAILLLLPLLFNFLVFHVVEYAASNFRVPLGDFELNKKFHQFNRLGTTLQLKGEEFFPEEATNKKLIWSTSDGTVAEVFPDGRVTAINNGLAVITAISEDGGIVRYCEIEVFSEHLEGFFAEVETAGGVFDALALTAPLQITQNDTAKIRVGVSSENALNSTRPSIGSSSSGIMSAEPFEFLGTVVVDGRRMLIYETGLTARRSGQVEIEVIAPVKNLEAGQTNSVSVSFDITREEVVIPPPPEVIDVEWLAMTVDGAKDIADTTRLTFIFDRDPGPLTAAYFSVTGAVKGTLEGTDNVRILNISGITTEGQLVFVSLASPEGYNILGGPKSVTAHKESETPVEPPPPPASIEVAWLGLTVDGAANLATTTRLTFIFDRDPGPLTAGNFTVTGAVKEALEGTGITRTLYISGIETQGQAVTAALTAAEGYTVSGGPRTINAHKIAPLIFIADGIYIYDTALNTTLNSVTLEVNRGTAAIYTVISGGAIAHIETTAAGSVLVFTAAGTVRVKFEWGTQEGYCDITSSLGYFSKDNLPLLKNLEQTGINIFAGQSEEINYDLSEALQFYDFEWTRDGGASLSLAFAYTASRLTVTANGTTTSSHTLRLILTGKPGSPVEGDTVEFAITVTILEYGPSFLELDMNKDAYTANFEGVYVFGNKKADGGDFEHEIRFSVLGGQNNALTFDWATDHAGLVKEKIITPTSLKIVFNKDHVFNLPAGQDYATVTITVSALRPSQSGAPVEAKYTYYIAPDAVNVGSPALSNAANLAELNANLSRSIVLHADIAVSQKTTFERSLYGNNFRLDGTAYSNAVNNMKSTIFEFIRSQEEQRSGYLDAAIVSNVRFLGNSMIHDGKFDFKNIQNHGSLVEIYNNTTMRYSRLEGATIIMRFPAARLYFDRWPDIQMVVNRNITIEKCLIAYGLTGAALGEGYNDPEWAATGEVTFRDLIFENCLTGIIFDLVTKDNEPVRTRVRLHLEGAVRFYTWMERDYVNTLDYAMDGVSFPVKAITNLDRTRDNFGKEYYNIAICVPFTKGGFLAPLNYASRSDFTQSTRTDYLTNRFIDKSNAATTIQLTYLISPPSSVSIAHYSPKATLTRGGINEDYQSPQDWLDSQKQPEEIRYALLYRAKA